MTPGDRYAHLLPARVRERLLLPARGAASELELQAHWFAGDFGREFRTVTGDEVRILQFGVWNREAGPDFSEAAVSINGGAPLAGPIELDPEARDWERHGHATNPAYESVILHVFTRRSGAEFFTRTLGHRCVPQVLLDLSGLPETAPNPQPEAKLGRCAAPLSALAGGEDSRRPARRGAISSAPKGRAPGATRRNARAPMRRCFKHSRAHLATRATSFRSPFSRSGSHSRSCARKPVAPMRSSLG